MKPASALLLAMTLVVSAACGTKSVPLPDLAAQPEADLMAIELDLRRMTELARQRGDRLDQSAYRIGPGDVISVSVFELAELDRTLRVSSTGAVVLPVVGEIKVGDTTPEQTQRNIEAALERVVVNPAVTVYVETYGSQRVQVLGAVRQPGVYALSKGRNRIYDLLGEAGGITPEAEGFVEFYATPQSPLDGGMDRWERERAIGLEPTMMLPADVKALRIPLKSVIGGGAASTLQLVDGDLIHVPRRGTYFVGGEVKQPGERTLSKGSTLLTAIGQAGGLGEFPEADEIQLVRAIGGEEYTFLIDYDELVEGKAVDPVLKAEDKILVPRNRLEAAVMGVIKTLGTFIGIGISPF